MGLLNLRFLGPKIDFSLYARNYLIKNCLSSIFRNGSIIDFYKFLCPKPPTDAETYLFKAIYLPASDQNKTPSLGAPEGFMSVPYEKIISWVKNLNCNMVLLYSKLITSSNPEVYNLTYGLLDYVCPPTGQTYEDKVKDSIDKCTAAGLHLIQSVYSRK